MKTWYKKSLYCGPGVGCDKCRVCKYYSFLDWADSVRIPDSTVEKDEFIEDFLKLVDKYEKVNSREKEDQTEWF